MDLRSRNADVDRGGEAGEADEVDEVDDDCGGGGGGGGGRGSRPWVIFALGLDWVIATRRNNSSACRVVGRGIVDFRNAPKKPVHRLPVGNPHYVIFTRTQCCTTSNSLVIVHIDL